tara:strand:+ start:307 stop:822 length:516 start_codon:yes stop_codon:yes gene_type:complete
MSAIHLKQEFKYCEGIPWDDVVDKIDNEYKEGTLSFFSFHQLHKGPTQEGDDIYGFMDGYLPNNEKVSPPTFGLHNEYHPNRIGDVAEMVRQRWPAREMQVFASLGGGGATYGKHKDPMNVLLVQSVGIMRYDVEGIGMIDVKPGDGIYIPKETYHCPYVIEPRITLSFDI